MKNKMYVKLCAAAVCAMFFCGCSVLFPTVKTQSYYDLNFSGKAVQLPVRISYGSIHNISPAQLNLLYFGNNGKVMLDQYNFWAQNPENMLKRFLYNALLSSSDRKSPELEVSLTIFDFKLDVAGKKSVLGIRGVIHNKKTNIKREYSYIIETPVEKTERACYIQGMNKCVEKFVSKLADDIQKF